MTTANKITVFRIILVPVFMAFLLIDNVWCKFTALILFLIASFSDFLDGYIARNYNQISDFGKFMDPLADKMLTTSALLILAEQGRIYLGSVAIMLVLAREFMVSGLRMLAGTNGKVIAASMFGKIKTVSQMIAIIVSILLLNSLWFPNQSAAMIISGILIWISTVICVISGIDYLIKNKNVFSGK